MTALANHFLYEFKTGLRSSSSQLMNYLFPLAFYAMMGLVMTQLNPGFRDTLAPSMVLIAMMTSNLLGLPGPLVEARDAGVFRSFKINGVSAWAILMMPGLSTIIHALIASLLITATAAPLFKGSAPANWGAYVLVTVVAALTFGAIGSLIGVIANGTRSTVLWSQLIFLPSMLIGGLMFPTSLLPESVRPLSMLLPTTYAMQAYLGLAYGQSTSINPAAALLILGVCGLLAFSLANYLFNWDSRNNARRGHPAMALLVLAPFVAGILLH